MIDSLKHTKLMVVGGSAGSLQVILDLIKNIVPPINFALVLVLHRKSNSMNILPGLLQQLTTIPIEDIEDKTLLMKNTIYIVPGDYHVLFDSETLLSLDNSDKVNYSRPSIDVTFRSGAEKFGNKMVAILLSGANADGVEGLQYVKEYGGLVWIQNPASAEVDYMPRKAMENVNYDWIFEPAELPTKINQIFD